MIDLQTLLLVLPVLLASLTLHELAHGVTATILGDPTPREQGRLTLNPLPHLDPLGTLLLVVTLIASPFAFGWAKPVQVQPRYFRRAREGMAIVAVAGPATNFVLALACLAPIRFLRVTGEAYDVLAAAFVVNVVLGVFNLIPIPPLDGSRVVGVLMSRSTYNRWLRLDQYGFIFLFALIFLGREQFREVFDRTLDLIAGIMGLQVTT
ncbi:MAG TPA: site-2 protease family protein [Gaiellaceae bacterium]|nr:site-2 protease family protein [Gaiellaceae bacterium]